MQDRKRAPASNTAPLPFLEAVKRELEDAGVWKGLPLLVLLYLGSKAL